MGLNSTVSSERKHIGFFGLRNAGKSKLVNSFTNQNLSLVSDVAGTTTDPVRKTMELLPLGPVVIIDTPGIDDQGELGKMRVAKTMEILRQTDIAILVVDSTKGLSSADSQLIDLFKKNNTPFIIAYNKCDLLNNSNTNSDNVNTGQSADSIYVSALNNTNINELKDKVSTLLKDDNNDKKLIGDLINPGDIIVLVVPIDSAAPKGRLILPQQQTIRDILDNGAISVVTREIELDKTLNSLKAKPKMVITDSQAFKEVAQITPEDVMLTSFSILFMRYKGNLNLAVKGVSALDQIKDEDTILICEGCTHHRQCEDIGTVKLPKLIRNYTKKRVNFEFTSGRDFPEDLSRYALVIHCGGCMLNEKEIHYRMKKCEENGIPVTNYGVAIAQMTGILNRSLQPFKM